MSIGFPTSNPNLQQRRGPGSTIVNTMSDAIFTWPVFLYSRTFRAPAQEGTTRNLNAVTLIILKKLARRPPRKRACSTIYIFRRRFYYYKAHLTTFRPKLTGSIYLHMFLLRLKQTTSGVLWLVSHRTIRDVIQGKQGTLLK